MPKVTLTFDNGPDLHTTPRVLDTLAEHGMLSTFFVVGKQVLKPGGKELLQQIRAGGHRIGNHTLNHALPLGATTDSVIEQEIGVTQQAIGAFADRHLLFRPFGGGGRLDRNLFSQAAIRYLCMHQYTCVLWNVVPRDWEDARGWPARALEQILAREWSVLVLHDIAADAMTQLSDFLARLSDLGCEVTQEYAPECVPIERDKILLPDELRQWVND
jgi:peptidoglycan-N-acetylglucosamine deacetylase